MILNVSTESLNVESIMPTGPLLSHPETYKPGVGCLELFSMHPYIWGIVFVFWSKVTPSIEPILFIAKSHSI